MNLPQEQSLVKEAWGSRLINQPIRTLISAASPKPSKTDISPKQQIKRHKHAHRMGSVPAKPQEHADSLLMTSVRSTIRKIVALARISWKLRPQALRAIHQSPSRCRVAYATETLRLLFGLKVVAIGFQDHLDWTTCWCADLRRPQAQRFNLRFSATRRDTKITRNSTKKQHCSSPRHMGPTSSSLSLLAAIAHVCPLFYMDELVRKTFAASRHAVFSCHFVRFSCPAASPRPEG